MDLDFQIHIRFDGTSIVSFLYNRPQNEWGKGTPLPEQLLLEKERATAFGEELLEKARAAKVGAVGVVIHVADEFATAELKQELNSPSVLNELREQAYSTPAQILDDSSVPVDQAAWRVLPYPAAGSDTIGTTISLSRRLDPFLNVLREISEAQNFPIITHSLSAPLVVMSKLPKLLKRDTKKPFIAILQYPWFTALGFFNEHADLRLVRTLQHRGLRRPSNFRHALATTNASLEFVDPDYLVVPLGEQVDEMVADDLGQSFPDSNVEIAMFPQDNTFPFWLPEPILSIEPHVVEDGQSHTFGALCEEKWFLQDFLPANKEVIELYPSKVEMKLLRFLKLGRIALFAIAALVCIGMALSIISTMNKEEWAFNEDAATEVQQKMTALTQERVKVDHWSSMLADRSKGWVSMEAIARLFPADSGLLLKTFTNNVRPDTAPGQAKVGFIKEWSVTGMARDEALSYLNSLNTRDGISAKFAEIAETTGNSAFDPTPVTRTLVVNVKTQENSSFRPLPAEQVMNSDPATYPFSFTLTITQRFSSEDPLAVSASQAP